MLFAILNQDNVRKGKVTHIFLNTHTHTHTQFHILEAFAENNKI